MTETMRWCGPCGAETWFEAPVFDDGFGADGELGCIECGHAVVLGHLVDHGPGVVTRRAA